jgi:hypothetical protein
MFIMKIVVYLYSRFVMSMLYTVLLVPSAGGGGFPFVP